MQKAIIFDILMPRRLKGGLNQKIGRTVKKKLILRINNQEGPPLLHTQIKEEEKKKIKMVI